MRTFGDLTEQEKAVFEKEFYALWKENFTFPDDRGWKNPFTYGRPWLWCGLEKFVPANEFFRMKKDKIKNLYAALTEHSGEF